MVGASALAPQGAAGAGVWPDSLGSGYGLSDMDPLAGSELVVSRPTAGGGVLSFSSRSDHSSFAGREGALALDGRVSTHLFGADYARGPVVLGLSFGRTMGIGGYDGVSVGRVESSVTGELLSMTPFRVSVDTKSVPSGARNVGVTAGTCLRSCRSDAR